MCVPVQSLCDYFCLRCTFCWTSKLNTSPLCLKLFYFGRIFCLACKVLSFFFAPSASKECKVLMWGNKSCHQSNNNTEKMLAVDWLLYPSRLDEGKHWNLHNVYMLLWMLYCIWSSNFSMGGLWEPKPNPQPLAVLVQCSSHFCKSFFWAILSDFLLMKFQ